MTNIIVAFAKPEDARGVKNILVRNGFVVAAVCTSGAQVLEAADGLHDGMLISGYRLADMICMELRDSLPEGFEMVILASQRVLGEISGSSMIGLSMPLKVHELISTVNMITQGINRRRKRQRQKPRVRSAEETAVISSAKALLMERNHMTEKEAHRYLQKHSMDNGTDLVETAQMLLAL